MSNSMILKPRISEKSYGLSQDRNTYVFVVPKDANKLTVAKAVIAQFEVTVTNVKITNVKGKVKRTVRKGGRSTTGRDSAFKKAYVTLKAGDTLGIFAAEDDDAKQPKNPAAQTTTRTRRTKEKK